MKLRILWRDRSNSSRLSPAPIRGPARVRVKAINAITTTTSIREKPFTLSQDAGKAQKDEGRICNFAQVLRISNEQSPMVTDRQFGSSFCIQQHRWCKRMLEIADWGFLNANCPPQREVTFPGEGDPSRSPHRRIQAGRCPVSKPIQFLGRTAGCSTADH